MPPIRFWPVLAAAALLVSTIALRDAAGERAAVAPPPAGTDDVIGLLDVRVEGLNPAAAEIFTSKIEEALEISGLKVASSERLRQYLAGTPWNAACLFGDCLRELRLRAAVATVIEVALATSGPSYQYVITLIDTESGQTINQLTGKCDVCTTEETFSQAALAVVELVNGVGDAAPTAKPIVIDHRPVQAAHAMARRRTRWLGLGLVATAFVAGVGSWYWSRDGRDNLAAGAAGGAGALGVAGLTSIGLSFSF
jgi:hypothetical protein